MYKRKRMGVAVLTAVVALVVAGCGSSTSSTSSSSSSPAATTSTSASTSTASGTPFVLGSICTCSDPATEGSLGKSLDVIQAWAKYTNANGGVNGHPVKVIGIDDGGSPAKALAAAQTLVGTDHVMAIVGMQSLEDSAWEKYVTAQGVPVVGGNALEPSYLASPDFYASGAALPMMLYGVQELSKGEGKTKLAALYCAEAPVCATLVPIMKAMTNLTGVAVTGTPISSTAPSYTAPCLASKGNGTDVLFPAVSATLVPTLVDACAQQGYKPLIVSSSGTAAKIWLSNPNLAGALVSASNAVYTDTAIPGVKTFNDAMNKYIPGLTSSQQFSWPLEAVWAGGQLFTAAAEAGHLTPTSTPAEVKKGLYALKGDTLDGISPPLTYSPGKLTGPPCYFPSKLANGAFQPVGSGSAVCVSAATSAKVSAALAG